MNDKKESILARTPLVIILAPRACRDDDDDDVYL